MDSNLTKLESACSGLKSLLNESAQMELNLAKMDNKFDIMNQSLSATSKRVAPLQSLAMATKTLDTRIDRAVSPALSLLESFKLSDSLQHKLIDLTSKLSAEKNQEKRLRYIIKHLECVENLNLTINSILQNGESVIQKLQEVVEFLSRTKATDQFRTIRLRETLVTLKALYETEVDAMRFEGLLDEALLNLQDEYESLLLQLTHRNIGEMNAAAKDGGDLVCDLGDELQVEVLRRISETLAANDCLDICIDIFVKVRYRRAAKALMRLNPDYLKTYTPEEIDEMEWGTLESAVTLWIQHFELAVKTVFVSEKKLCNQVLGNILDGIIWPECFVKIADKIMAVFFRFGEGVTRSSKEPQKLFKLLDMFDSLENFKPEFSLVFEGEAGADICSRFRELEKLIVHASSKVFFEFGLQIEGNSDGFPPPQDGSVPKLVRYAINYLKYLATDNYRGPMAKVLRTEQIWKLGILSKPETDDNLLRDAMSNIMEAIVRNIESKKLRYSDKILSHVFAMNTYWYIYMRTRNTELGTLLGEQVMKKNFKFVAEESAYMYQNQTWGPLIRLLDKEEMKGENSNREVKLEGFLKGFEEISKRHKNGFCIPDFDLREQICEATLRFVIPVYREFFELNWSSVQVKSIVSAEILEKMISRIFDGGNGKLRRRDSVPRDGAVTEFRRSRSNVSDL